MLRREAIRRLSICLGGTISVPVLSGFLAGCSSPSDQQEFSPQSLSPYQLENIGLIAESIIPRTDSPGALDAGVEKFIDTLLTNFYSSDNRRTFLADLDEFIQSSDETLPESFATASLEKRNKYIREIDAKTFPSPEEKESVEYSDVDEPVGPEHKPFFWQLKDLVLIGYYTSEIGATRELHIAPYTDYQGDIPLDSVGKTWA